MNLEENLHLILNEKYLHLLPEDLKEGITMFGINGTLDSLDREEEDACLVIAKDILGREVI